jgi:DMSO/TMAO reductase YedYZ molybdopterin-dependent catalytic subunit
VPDAAPLPPGQQLVAPGKWPVVGERSPAPLAGEWTVEVVGLVRGSQCWTLGELSQLPQVTRQIDVHCVTRWSRPAMEFRGVRLLDLLEWSAAPASVQRASESQESVLPRPRDRCDLRRELTSGGEGRGEGGTTGPSADSPTDPGEREKKPSHHRFISFVSHSDRGHSTSLPLPAIRELDPLLATHAEGAPLSREHGGPIRVVVPGKYFYKSLKWVCRIELLTEDRLGYWESHAGYHNGADPWKEERFLAADLDLQTVRQLVTSRNFERRDLRGIAAAGLDMQGLQATGAKLRDAHFEGADLRQANFNGANLSGAHLQLADLRGASFGPDSSGAPADLEGADFRGADLRGAVFRGASLFGVTLGPAENGQPTRIDETAIIDAASRATLEATPDQLAYLQNAAS